MKLLASKFDTKTWQHSKTPTEQYVDSINKFSSVHAKKIAATMAASFNRTKRSYELQNTTYRKTGSIDLSRIHSYKTSDDIFMRSAMMPNGKNHGIVMVLDWSGSISGSAIKIAMQYLITAYFLKQVKIPFSVSIFTSGGHNFSDKYLEDAVSSGSLDQVEIANDTFSYSQLQDAFNDLICASVVYTLCRGQYRDWINRNMGFGGTPLEESKLHTYVHAMKMKAERNIQNMTIMYITDGGGNLCKTAQNQFVATIVDPFTGRVFATKHKNAYGTPASNVPAINDMIRSAGIKTFNVYVDSHTSAMYSYLYTYSDIDRTSKHAVDAAISAICSKYPIAKGMSVVPNALNYNAVIFVTSNCFSSISASLDSPDDDGLTSESSVASLKRAITSDSKWMKGATVVGNLIVEQIVNEYAIR